MKHSIRIRLVITLAVLIGCSLLLCWVMNKTFLPRYYQNYKVNMLGEAYENACVIYEKYAKTEESEDTQESDGTQESDNAEESEGTDESGNSSGNNQQGDDNQSDTSQSGTSEDALDSEISTTLESLGANQSMSLYMFRLYQNQVGIYANFLYPSMDVMRQNQVMEQITSFSASMDSNKPGDKREILSETEKYQIVKVYDNRVGSYYLELLGVIDDKTWIYARSNYQSMMESVTISNQFLAYIGILVTIFGILIMYIVSKSFTKPILELSEIATRMSNLNFDIKYKITRNDEIGTLGSSINVLSEKLEETISELKGANNELQKDIEKKTQIDEMRTEFLSNVSHELKTPIALIQGYAEGLMENINEDEESRKFYCEVITDEAIKMNKMVKKLLSLNHIEFGENPITFDRFDIVEVVKSVLSSTDILFQQKEATLYFDEYEPIYVWADEYMVEEVVTNYVSNALNHIDGKRIVEVKLIKKDGLVRIAVYNTGEKIPEEDIEKIWDKFYKVDKARTREYGGSGIGLSIVKAIMTSMNQNFGVINHETGVEFWFELDCKN